MGAGAAPGLQLGGCRPQSPWNAERINPPFINEGGQTVPKSRVEKTVIISDWGEAGYQTATEALRKNRTRNDLPCANFERGEIQTGSASGPTGSHLPPLFKLLLAGDSL